MPLRVTTTSTNPNFKPFDQWFNAKIAYFNSISDHNSIQIWTQANDAKVQAGLAANQTSEQVNDNVLILSNNPRVEAFDNIHNQWLDEYQVNIVVEEI